MPIDKPDMVALTRREPMGVVAAIRPWNSPLLFVALKMRRRRWPPAARVVVKPSEFASVPRWNSRG